MATHTLYKYIWQHSRREQIALLMIALAAQPFYFLTLTLPKLIVNGPIQGKGFETPGATQPFLRIALEFPDAVAAWIGRQWVLFEGFALQQVPYLVALCLAFLALVGFNGFLKFLINTMKGRLGE